MALGPISGIGAQPPQPSPTRDVSGAQRAFFQAALAQATPVGGVTPGAAGPAEAAKLQKPAAAPEEAPKAAYRPGSLLDVKI
jgi:hypothetical protein